MVGCFFLFAACSKSGGYAAPAPGDPVFADGKRLVARTVSFPGTEPLFVGIYDRIERTPCTFETAADGRLRCLPETVPTPEPVARWVEGVAAPREGAAGRLRRHDVLSADGGYFPHRSGLFDSHYGAPCSPRFVRNADGTAESTCLPSAGLIGYGFADALCATPLAMVAAEEPLIAAEADGTLFALGGAWEGPVYLPSSDACNEIDPSSSRYFTVGEELPADAVVTVRAVPRGTGRLALQMVEAKEGRLTTISFGEVRYPWWAGPYFDRELGLSCGPLWTVDQEVRCLPADAPYVSEGDNRFADPGCTKRLVGNGPFAVLGRQDPVASRPIAFEVRRVGDTLSETAFEKRGDECTENAKFVGYLLGDVVPLTDFAKLEARTGEEP